VRRSQRRRLVVPDPAGAVHHAAGAGGVDPGLPVRGVRQPAATGAARMSGLLEIRGLEVRHGDRPILDGVDLTLEAGEALGLAGESGCGKTTTALALMRLLPATFSSSGTITLRPPGLDEPINVERRTEAGMQ